MRSLLEGSVPEVDANRMPPTQSMLKRQLLQSEAIRINTDIALTALPDPADWRTSRSSRYGRALGRK
jgi:hypothetical protein